MSAPVGTQSAPVYVVSGGTGASGDQLVRTILAQFRDAQVPVLVTAHVRQVTELAHVVEQAARAGGTIVHTLVDAELRGALEALAREHDVAAIDLMGPLIERLSHQLGQAPAGRPGLYRQQREAYFERVEAIEFSVAHDDGQRAEDLGRADVILVGPSRTGKTPLSMYLSVLGWKAANVPLIPGIDPPAPLLAADRRRVVGLTIEPAQLIAHRQWRRAHLGIGAGAPYLDAEAIVDEVEEARRFCRRRGFGLVDITDKPIESSAEEVIAVVKRRLSASGERS